MTTKDGPAGRDEAEMIAESRLDYLLDSVEAPEPSAALKYRIYGFGPAAEGRDAGRVSLWRRLGGLFSGGPVLRPVGGMAALAAALLIGVVVGYALPGDDAPDAARGQPVVAVAPAPLPLAASLGEIPGDTDPLSVDGINLIAPAAFQTASVATAVSTDEDDVGSMPLY